jgi:hypothetical protein
MNTYKITKQHTTIATLLLSIIGIVFSCNAFAGVPAIPEHPPWHEPHPDGHTYLVHVKSSFNTSFYDCYAFDKTSPGTLTVQKLYGQLLEYAHDGLNKDIENWQSTSLGADDFGVAFHGSTYHHGTKISGDGVNEYGNTFVFHGVKVHKCDAIALDSKQPAPGIDGTTLKSESTNPYRQE